MAGKRPYGSTGTNAGPPYPVLLKRPKVNGATLRDPHTPGEASIRVRAPDAPEEEGCQTDDDDDANPDASIRESGRTRWQLLSEDVPSAARKIYCVRRGQRPGFFFEWTGTNGAEAQVKGFQDNLFISFPQGKKSIKPDNLDEVIATALDFMNHDAQSCKYNCKGKCELVESAKQQQQQQHPTASKAKDLDLCRICHLQPPHEEEGARWRICHSCWISGSTQAIIHRSSQKLQLCDEQTRILEVVAKGRNVFFTGAAGTGKSRVLQAAVDLSKRLGLVPRVVAPTGMAAINVFGSTLHIFAGWSLKLAKSSKLELKKLAHEKKVWKRFKETDILIIDEISMVESDTLSRLSLMMSEALQNYKPFGGVQVIVSGDFYQLPPVRPFETCIDCGDPLEGWEQQKDTYTCRKHGAYRDADKWAFRSRVWESCEFANVRLTTVHRQADSQLLSILDRMRKGNGWSHEQEDLLLNHQHDVVFDEAVKLSPLRYEVDSINDVHMRKLDTPSRTYQCVDDLHWSQKHPEFVDFTQPDGMSKLPFASLQHHRYATELELKDGMQVILIQNLDIKAGLVNGTSGKVVGFEPMNADYLPRAKRGSKDVAKDGQETISHEHRQYAETCIRRFYEQAECRRWPIVQFNVPGGDRRTIYAHCSITELGRDEPYSLLSRTQIPLIAGWAITVHKSQGMTLSNLAVSLDKCFAPGQAYVALSRVRNLSSMIVQSLPSADKLRPDDAVQEFMARTFGV